MYLLGRTWASPTLAWLHCLMRSVAKFGKCCRLPNLANFVDCQNWQVSSVAKIGKCCHFPKLANVIGCQNWQMLSVAKIGKFWGHKSCQNWQVSSVAKFGKRCRLPKLANFEDTKVAKIGVWTYLTKDKDTSYMFPFAGLCHLSSHQPNFSVNETGLLPRTEKLEWLQ